MATKPTRYAATIRVRDYLNVLTQPRGIPRICLFPVDTPMKKVFQPVAHSMSQKQFAHVRGFGTFMHDILKRVRTIAHLGMVGNSKLVTVTVRDFLRPLDRFVETYAVTPDPEHDLGGLMGCPSLTIEELDYLVNASRRLAAAGITAFHMRREPHEGILPTENVQDHEGDLGDDFPGTRLFGGSD